MKDINEIVSALIGGTLKESENIELKRTLPRGLPKIAKNIVGIANSGGGYLILGVTEQLVKESMIIGVSNVDEIQKTLTRVVADYTIGVHVIPYIYTVDAKKFIVFQIEKTELEAYYSRRVTSPTRLTAYERIITSDAKIKEEVRDRKLYTKVYKYMTIETFLVSLYAKTWRFFEPNKWNDKFEQRFYCADYKNIGMEHMTPQLFATCVTREKNSEAAWKVYSHGQGLGSHCVQLELDIDKLRIELNKNDLKIAEMYVKYKEEKFILELHNKNKSKAYEAYFSSFSLKKFLKLLTLKRNAYKYENEIRLFAIPKGNASRSIGNDSQSKDLAIDWSKVIRKVRIDEACTDAELISIQQACFSAGINPVINHYSFICNIPKPANCVDVEFELYNVDAMPGKSRITIW